VGKQADDHGVCCFVIIFVFFNQGSQLLCCQLLGQLLRLAVTAAAAVEGGVVFRDVGVARENSGT
jgi:hypothetical protein